MSVRGGLRGAALALAALAAAGAPAAAAGPLEDLRAALQAVGDSSPVRAELVVEVTRQQRDETPRTGRATVTASKNGDGLQIGFAAHELAAAGREHAQTDPDRPRPVSTGLRAIDPVDVEAMLGYSRRLLAELDGARLLGAQASSHGGAPAQLLELELPVRLSESGRKRIKHAHETLKLWIGADGLPLALEEKGEYRGRIFLIIGFEAHQSRMLQFGRSGDRLIVLRAETNNGGSGLGESASESLTTTLKVL